MLLPLVCGCLLAFYFHIPDFHTVNGNDRVVCCGQCASLRNGPCGIGVCCMNCDAGVYADFYCVCAVLHDVPYRVAQGGRGQAALWHGCGQVQPYADGDGVQRDYADCRQSFVKIVSHCLTPAVASRLAVSGQSLVRHFNHQKTRVCGVSGADPQPPLPWVASDSALQLAAAPHGGMLS
jgi:hypothetical protein